MEPADPALEPALLLLFGKRDDYQLLGAVLWETLPSQAKRTRTAGSPTEAASPNQRSSPPEIRRYGRRWTTQSTSISYLPTPTSSPLPGKMSQGREEMTVRGREA